MIRDNTTMIADRKNKAENDEDPMVPTSDLFTTIIKECEVGDEGAIVHRTLYLADVEAFEEPAVVVPDVGAKHKAKYFLVTPRKDWAGQFVDWLKVTHQNEATMH